MRSSGIAWVLLIAAALPADAGGFRRHRAAEAVPPTPSVAPVPAWAARRAAESPVPLAAQRPGRRPWAYPLSTQATPSAYWARASQLGFGAGPIPGYTNGPGLGNIPSAPIGPGGPPSWGSAIFPTGIVGHH